MDNSLLTVAMVAAELQQARDIIGRADNGMASVDRAQALARIDNALHALTGKPGRVAKWGLAATPSANPFPMDPRRVVCVTDPAPFGNPAPLPMPEPSAADPKLLDDVEAYARASSRGGNHAASPWVRKGSKGE